MSRLRETRATAPGQGRKNNAKKNEGENLQGLEVYVSERQGETATAKAQEQ